MFCLAVERIKNNFATASIFFEIPAVFEYHTEDAFIEQRINANGNKAFIHRIYLCLQINIGIDWK